MNENIDLTKILEGCPEGTRLYSPLYGVVEFAGFYKMDVTHLILIITTDIYDRRAEISFLSDGSLYDDLTFMNAFYFLQKTKETGQSLRGFGISQRVRSLILILYNRLIRCL